MKNKRSYILLVVLIGLFMMTAGCDEQAELDLGSGSKPVAEKSKAEENVKQEHPKEHKFVVYFANDDASDLVAKEVVSKDTSVDKYTAAIQRLIEGTNENGAVSMIPPKTTLRGLKVENGIAYVNFSQELVKKFNGGSAGEIMLVSSVVNTLTEFPEVKAVQFMVDGEKLETIAGHMDTSEPLKRFKDLVKK